MSETTFHAQCGCGAIELRMQDEPKVRGICHCEDCRDLLGVPYHSVNAWVKEKVEITKGQEAVQEYQHPRLNMKKFFCNNCGDVIFNSNGMDWRVFSQLFVAKSYGGELPELLKPKMHFFYGRRIVNVDDELPKKE